MSSPLPNPLANSSLVNTGAQNASCGNADVGEFLGSVVNGTAKALGNAVVEEAKRWIPVVGCNSQGEGEKEWTGMGLEWLRSLLGGREWRLPCLDVYIRL